MTASLRRIYAIMLRQVYVIRHSFPRLSMIVFWPTLQILTWGFFNKFLLLQSPAAAFTLSTLLGASLLAVFFERSNSQIMWGFLEDVWSRNIGNILITPITKWEILAGYLLSGCISVFIGITGASFFAAVLFGYSILDLGSYAFLFILNLILSGWCVGMLLIALILRFGSGGEFFGWMIASLLLPFVAVYYPVSIMPASFQHISWLLPPTYMFEALRQFIKKGSFNWEYFTRALVLNTVYFIACMRIFLWQLHKARQRGGLLSMGE